MTEMTGASSYRRFLQGDKTALEDLMRTYSDPLIRFAYCYVKDSVEAEDIMEDAFAALILRRKAFSDCENFRAYLYKIVRNKSLDHLRRKKRKVPLSDLENLLCDGGDTEREAAKNERNQRLYRCMQQLPTQYEEALYLMYFEDYRPAEISKIIKKTEKQTYNILARAKTALKELLKKEGIFYEDL